MIQYALPLLQYFIYMCLIAHLSQALPTAITTVGNLDADDPHQGN